MRLINSSRRRIHPRGMVRPLGAPTVRVRPNTHLDLPFNVFIGLYVAGPSRLFDPQVRLCVREPPTVSSRPRPAEVATPSNVHRPGPPRPTPSMSRSAARRITAAHRTIAPTRPRDTQSEATSHEQQSSSHSGQWRITPAGVLNPSRSRPEPSPSAVRALTHNPAQGPTRCVPTGWTFRAFDLNLARRRGDEFAPDQLTLERFDPAHLSPTHLLRGLSTLSEPLTSSRQHSTFRTSINRPRTQPSPCKVLRKNLAQPCFASVVR